MEVDEKSVKVDVGMDFKGVEGKSIVNGEVGLERELQGSGKKCKELEDRCMLLELDVDKAKSKFELLEGKFRTLEVEKIRIEDEVKGLKKRNTELEERVSQFEKENNNVGGEKSTGNVVDLTEGKDVEDNVILMIENKVLECEKKRAESEAEVWKLKCREMESRVLELEKENLVWRGGQSQLAGTMKSQPRGEQTTKASDFKDGFYVVTGSGNSDAQDKMVNKNETIHAAIGISSICCSPLKGTPMIDMPSKQFKQIDGRKRGFVFEAAKEHGSPVRKQLEFGEEGSLSKKLAPSTPGVARPSFGVIDISDSEDEVANINIYMPHSESQLSRMACVSTHFSPGETTGDGNKKISQDNFKRTLLEQSDEEDMNGYMGNFPSISTPKRKRASNIVTTDSESDSDDNIPICKLKTKHVRDLSHDAVDSHSNSFSVTDPLSEEKIGESATPRRRLVALRECNVKKGPKQDSPGNANNGGANFNSGMPTNGGVENEETEEDELESDTEGESLGGFIVDGSDVSDGNDGSNASSDVSDDDADFDEVISRIRRGRDLKVKWEFEADMLAAFGKDLELCMKAVCALYRQQTAEERFSKGTFYSNQRGFSQCDALRGTIVAEFLTDGDPKGDLKKSVEELREYDPKAPELCRTLATHYSKQLFAIYKNKEDPLFLPS